MTQTNKEESKNDKNDINSRIEKLVGVSEVMAHFGQDFSPYVKWVLNLSVAIMTILLTFVSFQQDIEPLLGKIIIIMLGFSLISILSGWLTLQKTLSFTISKTGLDIIHYQKTDDEKTKSMIEYRDQLKESRKYLRVLWYTCIISLILNLISFVTLVIMKILL